MADVELWTVAGASVVRVFAAAGVLDAIDVPQQVGGGRVAPDELLLLGDPGLAPALVEQLAAALREHGPDALAVDMSAGSVLFALVGEGAPGALARVSDLDVQPGEQRFLQGRVAEVPARVFVRDGRIDLLVGADVSWFVRRRLLKAGAGAGLVEAEPPASAPVSNGAAG